MERKIDKYFGDLDNAVNYLLAANARGEHVYCDFNGHELHSDNVTMDSAYTEVLGCTKAEFEQRQKEWLENYTNEKNARKSNEQVRKITLKDVINGLKFIAEHQTMSQEDLIQSLMELGCNFSFEDIKQQFPEEVKLFEGMRQGNLGCGASVIANVKASEFGRAYCYDRFLSVDDDTSIYHFVRVSTGDETYTKEMVDALNNTNRKHR